MNNLFDLALFAINRTEMENIVKPIIEICDTMVPILLSVVSAVGAVWCILLGVKYSKADDPQEHEKAKKGLINAIIGFVLIFVLLIMLQVGSDVFKDYWESY